MTAQDVFPQISFACGRYSDEGVSSDPDQVLSWGTSFKFDVRALKSGQYGEPTFSFELSARYSRRELASS
jgi:hypothetical protein